ncbi:cytochrome-c peroxidase [Sulfurimonas sp.]|uniref:cytochrome-c peroxidase n=1 Tax=Sulfurimonas sp. TaxID=2022749 RepID=UPI0035672CB5
MKVKLFFIALLPSLIFSEPIQPLPQNVNVDNNKAKLGKELFFDPILSVDNSVSCAMCHDLQNGGDDGLVASVGHKGQVGDINAPTVLNAVYNFRQFWNGRSKDLKEQAKGPIENPIEMGNTFENLISVLKNSTYKEKFDEVFEDGITEDNIADAIAEYEKTLITPNSAFDRYLNGDKKAITKDQKEGYEIFKEKGCIACHHGINVGGNLYNKFGVMEDAKSKREGLYEVTKEEQDRYYFKVPSLRNVDKTAPYLHDGRYDNLNDVVKFMARYQLGRTISEDEVHKVVQFLNSLSGELPKDIR